MSSQPEHWNSELYQSSHSHVWNCGRDLLGLLDSKSGERILDVGCGTGQLTAEVARCGAEKPEELSRRWKELGRPTLLHDGVWIIDHTRLRMVAVKI